jgi:hypothetical protein
LAAFSIASSIAGSKRTLRPSPFFAKHHLEILLRLLSTRVIFWEKVNTSGRPVPQTWRTLHKRATL